jgi:hypothetical protein
MASGTFHQVDALNGLIFDRKEIRFPNIFD